MKMTLVALAVATISSAAFAEEYTQVGSVTIVPTGVRTYCPGDIRLVEVQNYFEGGVTTKARLETSKIANAKVAFSASTGKSVTWVVTFNDASFADCKATASVRMMYENGGVSRHELYNATFKDGKLFFTLDLSPLSDYGAITYQNIKNGDAVAEYGIAD